MMYKLIVLLAIVMSVYSIPIHFGGNHNRYKNRYNLKDYSRVAFCISSNGTEFICQINCCRDSDGCCDYSFYKGVTELSVLSVVFWILIIIGSCIILYHILVVCAYCGYKCIKCYENRRLDVENV